MTSDLQGVDITYYPSPEVVCPNLRSDLQRVDTFLSLSWSNVCFPGVRSPGCTYNSLTWSHMSNSKGQISRVQIPLPVPHLEQCVLFWDQRRYFFLFLLWINASSSGVRSLGKGYLSLSFTLSNIPCSGDISPWRRCLILSWCNVFQFWSHISMEEISHPILV